jgi:transaldolase/glucose-6-phosphate isomerase
MNKLYELAKLGQSIWYDNIRRALLENGELQALVEAGVAGVTSNPSIFEKAIAGSDDYDPALRELVAGGSSPAEIYESLAFEDIQSAADLLRPVYDRTTGVDGYVSLEVSPLLAHDTNGTIAEARRLFAALGRPNVMIKVPATPEGIPAIEVLIGAGINVNVTLIFSLDQYQAVMGAYLAGLERLAGLSSGADRDLSRVASVASFFVSRIDTAVDQALDQSPAGPIEAGPLKGKLAIASAKLAYARFKEVFAGLRWERLAARGARVQRPLWASTSTKNPDYPDTLYLDSLIGPHTVNTVPPATLDAFRDHGTVALSLESDLDLARNQVAGLAAAGVSLADVTQKLLDDGVAAFARSFESMMDSIAGKRQRLLEEQQRRSASLGAYGTAVDAALDEMSREGVVERLWEHDYTLWKPEPAQITNRLGWLHIADAMQGNVECIDGLVEAVRQEGYTDVVVLGMGGSSLAPEVFGNVFGPEAGGLKLAVLDSTEPGAVLALAGRLTPARTLFIVATKSGGTAETLSFAKFFYNWTARALGSEQAGEHFVAITDPGSKLEALAGSLDFRTIFLNDPNIGGRYSALSYFGLVPAALAGVDVEQLLDRAQDMAGRCEAHNDPAGGGNVGAWLGAVLAELALASPQLANLGDWIEQLLAESTGKEGRGILPVVGEPLGSTEVYGNDRLFVYLRLDGDAGHDAAVQALEDAGQPVVRLFLRDVYDLGEQFFLWEFATAVAGSRLGINPFDQPNVEAAKVLAREAVAAYAETGSLPEDEPAPLAPQTLIRFLSQAQPGDYVSLQAYLQPTAGTDQELLALRLAIRDRYKVATTSGYGPRFLHSTGQLHKGDAGNGLFVQFTAAAPQDVPIPDEAGAPDSTMTFGVLISAQALGDKRALEGAGRRVIRFHLAQDAVGGLELLARALAQDPA